LRLARPLSLMAVRSWSSATTINWFSSTIGSVGSCQHRVAITAGAARTVFSVIYDAATRRNKPAYLTRRRARSPSLSFQLLKRSSHPIFRREFFFLFPSCTTKQKYRNCPSVSHCHRRCWSGREDFDRRPPAHDLTGVFEPGEMRENSSGTKTPVRSIM
jgi:hypothetical protein